MNHENRVFWIDDENHLEKSSFHRLTPNKIPIAPVNEGKRPSGSFDDLLGFLWTNPVPADVILIPFVPAEVQGPSDSELII